MLKKALFETVATLIATVWALADNWISDKVYDKYLEDKDHGMELMACLYVVLYVPIVFVYNLIKTKLFDK